MQKGGKRWGRRVEIKGERERERERERDIWNLGLVCGMVSDDCNDGDDVCNLPFSLFYYYFYHYYLWCLSALYFCLITDRTHSSNQPSCGFQIDFFFYYSLVLRWLYCTSLLFPLNKHGIPLMLIHV